MIRAVLIGDPCRTSGSQKCSGASPSFIDRAIVNMMQADWLVSWKISHVPVDQALIVLENRMVAEAAAWIRKYFVAASVARGWCCLAMIGIMARVFNSSPIQASSQWKLAIVITEPRARLDIINEVMRGFISIGGD